MLLMGHQQQKHLRKAYSAGDASRKELEGAVGGGGAAGGGGTGFSQGAYQVHAVYSCPLCRYAAPRRDYLIKHMRTHTGERPYTCPHCPYTSTQKNNLNRHIESRHKPPAAEGADQRPFLHNDQHFQDLVPHTAAAPLPGTLPMDLRENKE